MRRAPIEFAPLSAAMDASSPSDDALDSEPTSGSSAGSDGSPAGSDGSPEVEQSLPVGADDGEVVGSAEEEG